MLLGGMSFILKDIPLRIFGFIWQHTITEIDITNQDKGYRWVDHWLNTHPFAKRWIKSVSFTTEFNSRGEPILVLTPAPGFHFLFHNKKLFWIYKYRDKSNSVQNRYDSKTPPYLETIKICTLGGDRSFVNDLLLKAYTESIGIEESGVNVYNYNGYWKLCDIKPFKDPRSLVLDQGVLDSIFNDTDRFLASRDWYESMSIPWRRGYLLHGSPGSGKSSLVLALASHVKMPVYVVNLADPDMSDSRLIEALSDMETNKPCVLLLEEIDCIFNKRDKADDNSKDSVTFAGLLNALDGLTAPEGRVLMMTTNHFDRLDPALIRPGRADVHLFIDKASSYQIEQMVRRFFVSVTDSQVASILEKIPSNTISMAFLQEQCLRHRESVEDFISNINIQEVLEESYEPVSSPKRRRSSRIRKL